MMYNYSWMVAVMNYLFIVLDSSKVLLIPSSRLQAPSYWRVYPIDRVGWGLTCWPQAPRSSRSCAEPCWQPRWSRRCRGRWGGVEGGSSRRWPPPTQWWLRRDVAWRRPVAYRTALYSVRTHRALLDCAATLDSKHWNTGRGPLGAGSRSRSDKSQLFTRFLSSIETCLEWSILICSNAQSQVFFYLYFIIEIKLFKATKLLVILYCGLRNSRHFFCQEV